MHFDTSLSKKQAISAISSGNKYLPATLLFDKSSSWDLQFLPLAVISVNVTPGAIAFTLIPLLYTRLAIPPTRLFIATFDKPYGKSLHFAAVSDETNNTFPSLFCSNCFFIYSSGSS